ncbi:MAG: FMN-binding glutamate synthase family protein [Bacteroidota bacterium]|nr:FMN-binding glutamate synthase family protein [Bacteroidota bacterium]MDX5506091.1 FMN-binding glutamate synthase family protein [Bacteroidota bacterium]
MRSQFWTYSLLTFFLIGIISWFWPSFLWTLVVILPLFILGVHDTIQRSHTIRRNFPLFGRGRYILEDMGPKIYQYFVESDTDGRPINRNMRSMVYRRAKSVNDTHPFGTQRDLYRDGYEWINHSIYPYDVSELDHNPRVRIGGKECKQPYEASILNISAMSYGSLSYRAIEALNKGARMGGFYHNTGEGGLSPYHLENGGDIVWQIGTGYFSCRTKDGNFDREKFKENAAHPSVKMIEIKLSQGAKPGHGGILPASKNSEEIAKIRGVEPHKAVISPSYHKAFSGPKEMMHFIRDIRELCEGKPVGFKLCVGREEEFIDICRAMMDTGILPDFITVDGGEGGTGAAPLEYSNSVGSPLRDGLAFVHDMLVGFGLRDEIKVIASGKILSGFHIVRALALGADLCNSARGMMLSLGCIQALECNQNTCPTGVATQNPKLVKGLVVEDKSPRVHNFHKNTIHAMLDLLSSVGIKKTDDLKRKHIHRRVDMTTILRYDEIYPDLEPRCLLSGSGIPDRYKVYFRESDIPI